MRIDSFQSSYGGAAGVARIVTRQRIFFTILFALIYLWPTAVGAATFFIDPEGKDARGRGSKKAPWASLSYACRQVKSAGDTIHITPGTYTDNNTCELAIGVNILGAGKDKVTINSYMDQWYIRAKSKAISNGDQEISGFTLNGGSGPNDRRLERGILVQRRNNVSIHHARFQNILNRVNNGTAVTFMGNVIHWDLNNTVPPTQWVSGCRLYDCEFKNCSGLTEKQGDSLGAVRLIGLSDMRIYNNKFDETETQGQCLKAVVGWLKGAKIHDNIFKVADESIQREWHMAIELWNLCEDSEIYNNKFYNGWCSFVSGQKLNGSYSLRFHHNKIYNAHYNEFSIDDVLVEHNFFKGRQSDKWGGGGVALWQTWASAKSDISNLTIRNNVFSGGKLGAIYITDKKRSLSLEGIKIYNNVIDGVQGNGITILGTSRSTYQNFKIKNNIIINCSKKNIANNASIRSYDVSHNLDESANLELNYSGNQPDPYYRASNAKANVVDAGTHVGIPFLGSAPDVGAFEYEERKTIPIPQRLRIDSQ